MKPLVYIATSNPHKVSEFSEMFEAANFPCDVRCAGELPDFKSPVEDGDTFERNAFIKAEALEKIAPVDSYVMADDSGIVVDALDGAPGIMSARFAGVYGAGADAANNAKLLAELADVPDEKRTARFVCAIALICPDGVRASFSGKIEGVINHGAEGVNGFGYDPLFFLPERKKTTAQLSSREKNTISHRGNAFKKLAAFLKAKNK